MRLDIDLQPIKEQIQRFTIKPFATDYVVFGDWRVAAHAGGYFLLSDTGHRFSFRKDEQDVLFETLEKIKGNELEIATYATGTGAIRYKGTFHAHKFKRVNSANDYFEKALAASGLTVVCYGSKSEMYETKFAAIVVAA